MEGRVPWRRIFAEGLVIVGSILLAFGVDAWWDNRGQREPEREVLAALELEMAQNKEGIEEALYRHEGAGSAVLAFLASTPAELAALTPDSASAMASRLATVRVFTPLQGVMNGQELTALRDSNLRLALATWGGIAADQAENRPQLFYLAEAMWRSRALARGGGPQEPVDAAMLARLRNDASFSADLEVLNQIRNGDRGKLARLREQTNAVLELIRGRQE